MTYTHAVATNAFGPAAFIVDATVSNGTHTTIQAAITAAVAGQTIFVKPGSYTENLTLKIGTNIVAFTGDSGEPNVTIIGKATATGAGTFSISNIRLQTNSDFFLVVSGSSATIVNLNNCYLNCSTTTGISFTTANTSAAIYCYRCTGNLGTTGIGYHASSSTGNIIYEYCDLMNSGGSSTVTSNSAGGSSFEYCLLSCPIGTTSTGSIVCLYCNVDSAAQNVASLTANGSGASSSKYSAYASGSASSVTVGTGATLNFISNTVGSSNANAITGAGTIAAFGNYFTGTSQTINTTTQNNIGNIQGYLGSGTVVSAGFIGESLYSAANTSLITATAKTVTSLNLTAGIWDVTGIGNIVATTGTVATVGISTTTNTITGTQGDAYLNQVYAFSQTSGTISAFRVALTATTTYYLIAQATFVSGGSVFGRLSATRVG